MKNKFYLISLIILNINFLISCASEPNKAEYKKVRDIHAAHQNNKRGVSVDDISSSWNKIEHVSDGRNRFKDDLRLPNPELLMTVFPNRNEAGAIRPSYQQKFSMYEKVHYKIGY